MHDAPFVSKWSCFYLADNQSDADLRHCNTAKGTREAQYGPLKRLQWPRLQQFFLSWALQVFPGPEPSPEEAPEKKNEAVGSLCRKGGGLPGGWSRGVLASSRLGRASPHERQLLSV